MEVDQYEFKTRLLGILASICNASFISFDLEMSGINRRTKEQQNAARNGPKPTLEEHYKGMREATESYQVLQVGICCVEEVREKRFYLARPYNFNLSPLEVDPKHPMFDMDRQMKFSGEACKFLALERFDFGKVFSCGVTYLSRVEEAGLRQSKAPGRNEKRRDIEFALRDPGYVFYEKLRDTITAWAKDAKPNSYINISHPDGPEFDLNGLQRRLVHQLLANEFPTFKAHSKDKGAWMQVRPIIAAQEAEEETRDQEKFRRKISRQIGLRWVIEALINGNLDGIPVDWFYDNHSEDPRRQKAAVDELFDSLKTRLKKKKHIIVGHNLFADLGFLYSTFIGALPPTVTEFQKVIHEVFPVVMDTKYIATANHDSMSSQGKLMDLLRPLQKVNGPMIVLDEEHLNYAGVEKEHEAGFDSWITAELFLKMSMQLYDARKKALNIGKSVQNIFC
ncbi:ribonuclease H-like domain-containing protein [Bisporella sp. PMI_857]|nr:ribonuclease H-like domain-containing protein [Bisporella sp. PMI_857]